ncbi:hypothetical protein HJC23_012883 [Cyclotella cryptica]|uniref:Uncharacterized protein n=1 Tax=Cyclotella cryptica TaxID=29204 RepID=A0ABD3Q3G7_9STRA|eukprot:CCRYP_009510-RA/>CCRYP_009510-RA protein AED:0.03 eAED:0.03 QI:398/1/1/1/0.5/0.33/3/1093/1024
MPRIAVMNNMNPDRPHADFHAPHDSDQQQQFVNFSSRVFERKTSSEGDGEGIAEVGGYDSRYPNSELNSSGNNDDANEDSVSILRTPAQTPRNSSAAVTAATNIDPAMTSTVSRFGRDFARLAATTPFASVGRTPLTGASLGSSYDPTPRSNVTGSGILKSSNYGTANVNPSECNVGSISMNAGNNAMGLIRGNDPLGPTPLVRRNVPGKNKQQQKQSQQLPTPSPGMHYHFPMMSGIKTFDSAPPPRKRDGLPSVEEEDPAMLRYTSMAGSDQSPLVSRRTSTSKPEENNDKQDLDEIEASRTPPTHPDVLRDSILREQSASAYTTIGATPQAPPTKPQSEVKAPSALSEFPFYFDGYASWVCRHCSHISPYYRGENYIWHFPQAPPNEFVDHHLIFCPGLNSSSESVSSQQQQQTQQPAQHHPSNDYRFHPTVPVFPRIPGGGGMSYHAQQQQQQHLFNKQKSAPDPPTGRSPPPTLPNQESKGDGAEVPPYFHVQSYPNQPFQAGQHPYNIMPQHAAQSMYMIPPHGSQPPPFPFGLSGTVDASPSRSKRRSTGKNVSPKGRPSDDDTYTKAMEHLDRVEEQMPDLTEPDSDVGSSLVEKSDSDLITDYFYHIMKQLVVCRFAEKDRKTRGGKRENVNIGYGGLQCRHCINAPSSRKFFWSNVDRLANSFAEIPTHVLKCKSTPEDIKDSLLVLKGRHPEQMQLLARGSQKVFFRRMWRRLHDGDATRGTPTTISEKPSRDDSEVSGNTSEDASKSGDARPSAARMLDETLEAESAKAASRHDAAFVLAQSMRTGSNRGVLLAIPEDKEWLSDDQCFVRNNIEVFVATSRDCEAAAEDRKYPIKPGQIGIRCVHCAQTPNGARGSAVFYPYTISGIYESVREFQRMHFEKCENLPAHVVEAAKTVSKASTTLSSVLRRYYVQSARALGLVDAPEGGIKAGAKPEPMSRAGFSSPVATHRAPSASATHNPSLIDPANLLLEMSRKRKAPPDPFDEVHSPSKRQHSGDEEHDHAGTPMKHEEV